MIDTKKKQIDRNKNKNGIIYTFILYYKVNTIGKFKKYKIYLFKILDKKKINMFYQLHKTHVLNQHIIFFIILIFNFFLHLIDK